MACAHVLLVTSSYNIMFAQQIDTSCLLGKVAVLSQQMQCFAITWASIEVDRHGS
jgi:hypothetical protein